MTNGARSDRDPCVTLHKDNAIYIYLFIYYIRSRGSVVRVVIRLRAGFMGVREPTVARNIYFQRKTVLISGSKSAEA
jgi:hypothetical protein